MTTIRVFGTPAPQGSKQGRAVKKGGVYTGRVVMHESSAEKVESWRQDVIMTVLREARGIYFDGPVRLTVGFLLRRPASHYRTGKNAHLLRDAAPRHPGKKPDIDKLLRSTLDGLGESGIWRDDAQVVEVVARKLYADHEPTGAHITIEPLGENA